MRPFILCMRWLRLRDVMQRLRLRVRDGVMCGMVRFVGRLSAFYDRRKKARTRRASLSLMSSLSF
ncbi:hypothetical protein BIY29_14930 [Brenneria alni]|uniref:Uncharacterized protein n=1 Tax=Brenneria alni TaxID=71656 RepID=A0A421DKW6_9GAMM|nr:hypothetical protein [Brenneria alni]RLM20559.1 hypothetical protein BIY29_14930 [Brenneria alni]